MLREGLRFDLERWMLGNERWSSSRPRVSGDVCGSSDAVATLAWSELSGGVHGVWEIAVMALMLLMVVALLPLRSRTSSSPDTAESTKAGESCDHETSQPQMPTPETPTPETPAPVSATAAMPVSARQAHAKLRARLQTQVTMCEDLLAQSQRQVVEMQRIHTSSKLERSLSAALAQRQGLALSTWRLFVASSASSPPPLLSLMAPGTDSLSAKTTSSSATPPHRPSPTASLEARVPPVEGTPSTLAVLPTHEGLMLPNLGHYMEDSLASTPTSSRINTPRRLSREDSCQPDGRRPASCVLPAAADSPGATPLSTPIKLAHLRPGSLPQESADEAVEATSAAQDRTRCAALWGSEGVGYNRRQADVAGEGSSLGCGTVTSTDSSSALSDTPSMPTASATIAGVYYMSDSSIDTDSSIDGMPSPTTSAPSDYDGDNRQQPACKDSDPLPSGEIITLNELTSSPTALAAAFAQLSDPQLSAPRAPRPAPYPVAPRTAVDPTAAAEMEAERATAARAAVAHVLERRALEKGAAAKWAATEVPAVPARVQKATQIARLAAQRDRLEARRDKLKYHMDRNGGVLSLPLPDSPRVRSGLQSRLESSQI